MFSQDKWVVQGVLGHFNTEKRPWVTIEQTVKNKMAKLVGAEPIEVSPMNSLSVNLHVRMAAFTEPHAILGALPLLAVRRTAWRRSTDVRGLPDAGGAPRVVIGAKRCSTTHAASSTCSFVHCTVCLNA